MIESKSGSCQWTFDHYKPSPWEKYWSSNIEVLKEKVCGTLAETEHLEKSIRMIKKIVEYQKSIFRPPLSSTADEDIFSKMFYRYECSETRSKPKLVSHYIEPIIGLVRDPLTICGYQSLPTELHMGFEESVQSKRFILLGPSAPYENYPVHSQPSVAPWLYNDKTRLILIDLGASLFNGGPDPKVVTTWVGARWFYDYFTRHAMTLDKIVAFEFQKLDTDMYWSQIPDDIIAKLTFINVGVGTAGALNPWNMLTTIAKPNDYVFVKLDIDNSPIENELMRQVVENASISSLIDEMFFEMHVNVNEMSTFWGPGLGDLQDTYVLFTKLRNLGIRMHSWP